MIEYKEFAAILTDAFRLNLTRSVTRLAALIVIFPILFGQTPRSRAVIIGVRRYPSLAQTKPLQFSNQDADLFGQFLRSGKAGPFDSRDIIELKDEAATLDSATLALRRALLGAQPKENVYVFISARGMARPGAADGYLGTSDLVELKPEGTGIPVSDLKDMINFSHAERVFLFADVCRDPPSTNIENRINIRLEDLGKVSKVTGFLASERQQLSLENGDLRHDRDRGFGVFGYILVNRLEGSPANTGADAVFEYLKKEMAVTTGNYR